MLGGFLAISGSRGQEPLTIDNLTDRSVHPLRVWFRVPSVSNYTYRVSLDDRPVPTDVTHWVESADYHELQVARTNLIDNTYAHRLVRFIVQSERGGPERGLVRWTPYPTIASSDEELAGARLRVIAPARYPADLPIPLIAWVDDAQGSVRRVNGKVTAPGYEFSPIRVCRGVGSGFLPAAGAAGALVYQAGLGVLQDLTVIQIETNAAWTAVSGLLAGRTQWAAGSRILVEGSLTIPADGELIVKPGTVVKLHPLVNITNHGRLIIEGTSAEPVVFTSTNLVWPERHAGAWGGFILRGAAAELLANDVIFVGGGGAERFDFAPGAAHRSEQALLLVHSGARASLTHCQVLNTAGQVGNGYQAHITFDHCLVQRAITAGEYVGGVTTITDSAFIDFPAEDADINAQSADADYDALYFTEGTHEVQDSLIGFCLDDAIDSGSGGAGSVAVTHCWIESALHEALAWSGAGRRTLTRDTVVLNSGQGIECGWSTGDDSPDCFADGLLSMANAVGARFGDNYDWSYNGFLRVTNSLLLHNVRDVFLKTWNAPGSGRQAESWIPRLDQVDFRGNWVTAVDPALPGNLSWDPGQQGERLVRWMTTPPGAAVGIGWAVRTNAFPMAELWNGLPVRLSSFTTNQVSVDYRFVADGIALGGGRLDFAPGETVKRVYPLGFDLSACNRIEAILQDPVHGQLTALTQVCFSGHVAYPRVSFWTGTNVLPLARLAEGMLLRLTAPAGQVITVHYAYTAAAQVLERGTVTFPPGETVREIPAGAIDVAAHEAVQLRLEQADGALLHDQTLVSYGMPPVQIRFAFEDDHLDLASFAEGLPVGLNRPAAEVVEVGFRCEASGQVLAKGSLAFGLGEMEKVLRLPSVDLRRHDLLWVSLLNPRGAELAKPFEVVFLPRANAISPVLVPSSSVWRYRDDGQDAGTVWREPGYDDSTWLEGAAQLGFGDGDEATLLRRWGTDGQPAITLYFRQPFPVANPGEFTNLVLELLRDDGGVVYLNGLEVYRSPTLPPPPEVIAYRTLADALAGSDAPPDNTVDVVQLDPAVLVSGINLVAVEIHQHRADSSDVSFSLLLAGQPAPPSAPLRLHWGIFGGRAALIWAEAGAWLEAASKLDGQWTRLPWAASPLTLAPTGAAQFYRLAN